MVYRQICTHGRDPDACAETDIRAYLSRGRPVEVGKRLCPAHDDTAPSLSVNPGTKGMRIIWNCLAGCHEEDVRAGLLSLGIDPSCLGDYGDSSRRRSRVADHACSLVDHAGIERWEAAAKLSVDLDGWLYKMCVQAIGELAPGRVTADPYALLPVNQDDFIALARRTGIERGYSYRVFRNWLQRGDAKRGTEKLTPLTPSTALTVVLTSRRNELSKPQVSGLIQARNLCTKSTACALSAQIRRALSAHPLRRARYADPRSVLQPDNRHEHGSLTRLAVLDEPCADCQEASDGAALGGPEVAERITP